MANRYYHYDPSFAAAAIFILLFVLSTAFHVFQLVKSQTWYFIPFLVGCFLEIIGYFGRAVNAKQTPEWTLPPYIIQALLLLLGPSFFAASIYMTLGRLIRLLHAEKKSLVKPVWLTKVFLVGDVISIAAQAIGGAKLASADSEDAVDLGQTMIITGLAVQIAFFTLFMVVIGVFHYRINKEPTTSSLNMTAPWRRLLHVLYTTSLLILVRSIFRVDEYVTGQDGKLQSEEIYIYIFDASLMFAVTAIFNIFHPSRILNYPEKVLLSNSDSTVQLNTYSTAPVFRSQMRTYSLSEDT